MGGFQCVDPKGNVSLLKYPNTGNYVCFSPEDARTLLEASSVKGTEIASNIDSKPRLKSEVLARAPLKKAYYELKTGEKYREPLPYGELFLKHADEPSEAE